MASRSREIFVKATHIEIYKKKRIEFKKTKQSKQAKNNTHINFKKTLVIKNYALRFQKTN